MPSEGMKNSNELTDIHYIFMDIMPLESTSTTYYLIFLKCLERYKSVSILRYTFIFLIEVHVDLPKHKNV
jgi:hypothetical protein